MLHRYRLSNVKTNLDSKELQVKRLVAKMLKKEPDDLLEFLVVKRSVDARKRSNVYYVLQVEFLLQSLVDESKVPGLQAVEQSRMHIPTPSFIAKAVISQEQPVVVVGAGPAGMFAALALAEAGVKTILLERGKPVETRMKDIGSLRAHGTLDPESNVCFGEGGAGAYTDGKLYTRIKHPYVRWVMKRLVDFEADPEILKQAHPHLGTDKLVRIVKGLRQHLIGLGVDVRFQQKVSRLIVSEGSVRGVSLASGEHIPCRQVILAIGHSARDTLEALIEDGVCIEAKPFAVGVRVEHSQSLIDKNQYGSLALKQTLGAAAYQLTHQHPDPHIGHRGIYSFCMCPGGFIVPSPTEPGRMAVNGMSNARRSTPYANSGMVVQVTPDDLRRQGYKEDPLMGIAFQRDLEARTFQHTQKEYAAPAMRISDFVAKKPSAKLAPTNFRPLAEPQDLWQVLPSWIAEPLAEGFRQFDRKIKGFISNEANMMAVESRTSSPLRITRGQDLQSVTTQGLYPVGEGAGYAGGIVSAAVDGVKAAEAIVSALA